MWRPEPPGCTLGSSALIKLLKFNTSGVRNKVWTIRPDLPPGNFYIPLIHDADVAESSASKSSISSSNKDDLSARAVTLYTVLGVLFGSLLSGGFVFYDLHPFLGGILGLVGAGGLMAMTILLASYRLKITHALIVAIAALVATWAFLAYDISTKPKEVIVHDAPTTEDIEKATAPIRADRDAQKQRADNAQLQQAGADQTQISKLQLASATVTNERDNLRRSLEETTSLLNATRAQLGPKSSLLGLDYARKWNILVAMNLLTKNDPCRAAIASDLGGTTDGRKSIAVFTEVREIFDNSGWTFGQAF